MRKIFLIFAVFFIYATTSAQQPKLINSGDVISQAAKLIGEQSYKEAIKLYKTVPAGDSNYSIILHELSFACYLDSAFDASISYAQEGMALFPEKADGWYNLMANALDSKQQYKEAISYYDSSLKLNAYSIYTWFNKGLALYNYGKKDEAKNCFQKVVLINPYHASSHFYLGLIYTEQGKLPQAMLCFTTNLLVDPENRYMNRSVNNLSVISKVTDEISLNASKASETENDNFEFLQEILLSKAALDAKYKLKTDIDDPITRQLQVLLEKLNYDTTDKGFCMQYYVPFYSELFKRNEFNAFLNYVFSGLDIKSVKNYNEKNKKEIEHIKDSAVNYLNLIRRTEVLDYSARVKSAYKYYYGENTLSGIGNWIPNEADDILTGSWQFFYANGQLKSGGNFNNTSEKDGDWIFYYENGVLKEKSTFKKGDIDGKVNTWYDNGNVSGESFYIQDKLDGESKSYYFNAFPKSAEKYKSDAKEGDVRFYTYDGFLNYTAHYTNNQLNGPLTFYYKDGKTETIKNFTNGKLNGTYKHYNENGVLDMDGNYADDKPVGIWKEYYNSKALKAEYSYANGEIEGVYKTYHENGKPLQIIQYSEGKTNGKDEDYDEDGIKYSESVYEKGKLREMMFFDKSGKVISTSSTRKGAGNLVFYRPDGTKSSEGFYNKDGEADGKSTYYFKSGEKQSEMSFKNGLREGERTIYYANGNISEKINFNGDEENGLLLGYHINNALRYAGNFVDGEKQGEHQNFNLYNTMLSSLSYLNDELDGYCTYYTANGKKTYQEKYRTGWLINAIQFDTAGNIIAENNFTTGNGDLIYKHLNGNVFVKATYRNYLMQGRYESFFFDGSPQIIRYYKNGLEDSMYIAYNYGGKLYQEGKYDLGEKTGKWKFYNQDGQLYYSQDFAKGKLNGTAISYNQDGTKIGETTYENDMHEGPSIIYGSNNEVAVQLNYHNDELVSYTYTGKDGKFIEPVAVKSGTALVTAFYANGNKSVEINYEGSVVNGSRKIYFNNGRLYSESIQVHGYDNGPARTFFADGKPATDENYVFDNLHGLSKAYYVNGQLKYERSFYEGEENSISKYYSEDGKLKETRAYYFNTLLSVNK